MTVVITIDEIPREHRGQISTNMGIYKGIYTTQRCTQGVLCARFSVLIKDFFELTMILFWGDLLNGQ